MSNQSNGSAKRKRQQIKEHVIIKKNKYKDHGQTTTSFKTISLAITTRDKKEHEEEQEKGYNSEKNSSYRPWFFSHKESKTMMPKKAGGHKLGHKRKNFPTRIPRRLMQRPEKLCYIFVAKIGRWT